MKSFLNGLKKVFGFTVRHRLTKGWKTATLIVMLLCFALPLGIRLSLGIGGVLTFKNARKLVEVVEYAPLESLLLETDSPYLAPVPNRGKRNSSLNIPYVVEKIAEIKGVSREEVEEITWKNSFRVFSKVK